MKPRPTDDNEDSLANHNSLGHALRLNKRVKVAIKQAASGLASATSVLKRGKKTNIPAHTIEEAIAQYDNVEHEVEKAADDLSQVNAALRAEVVQRVDIESELADTKNDLAEARDDLSESQANEHEARQLALHDTLTGLPNRALFEAALDHGMIQARRHGWRLAVLFIDIDDFKGINDSYGHHVGDEVLIMVANRLRSSIREEDMVSRWGGDEYVCLLLEVKQEADLTCVAEKMIGHIAETFESQGAVLSVGCSIGIAVYPEDGEAADILVKNADTAMYRAKRAEGKVALSRDQTLQEVTLEL